MMDFDWGHMMGGSSGAGALSFLLWLMVFIDLILLGVWLFKQIGKK